MVHCIVLCFYVVIVYYHELFYFCIVCKASFYCVFAVCYPLILYYFFLFFFFKQKTAYEMRISDWSSDVCSSDLGGGDGCAPWPAPNCRRPLPAPSRSGMSPGYCAPATCSPDCPRSKGRTVPAPAAQRLWPAALRPAPPPGRSEEHTSELQSLMRISYDVFCLKKQINTNTPSFHVTLTLPRAISMNSYIT